MDSIEYRLLNEYQRNFPLVERPYASIASSLGVAEQPVLDRFARLTAELKVSRIGATFAAGAIGAAALAALAVPHDRIDRVAAVINRFGEVNHNYEREHHYNLWFVVTGPDEWHVATTVRDIESAACCGDALLLPMVEAYRVDLGFDLRRLGASVEAVASTQPKALALSANEKRLVNELQNGLPLTSTPYAHLAQRAGMGEAEVLATLARWIDARAINRFGVIVRHHELGFCNNAMVVWDVPDNEVATIGRHVAAQPFVTLCYRRMRQLPAWRYNLYCMVHGTDRSEVLSQVAQLRVMCYLLCYPHEILFSRRRFKQTAAQYLRVTDATVHG